MSDPERLAEDLKIARAALGVARQLDLNAVAEAFVAASLEFGGASAAFLYLYDGEQDTFQLRASHIPPDDPRRKGIVSLDLAELRGPGAPASNWSPTITQAPEALRRLSIEQILAVPLPGAGALLGMLLLARERQVIPPDDVERVGRLVPELLPALFNAILVERYKELVIKDDQTESYNRRYFDRFLSEEVYRAHRYTTSLSLIFLDMDNLKEINNRYGHAMGSKALREISRRLVKEIRGSDKLFRYGGDEFCVVLPETDLRGARELAERLRVAVGSRPFLVDDTPGMTLTASFGIASYPDHARTSLALIKCADRAMQRIKVSGKNSIGVSVPGEEQAPQTAGIAR
ncbi:MAG TPA: GGDEF domain-containing protein [Candidatus Polarisedimenticolia bacterium]|nr:GGDEF domain-containing protein [Candidatus Polarisedimenticolia bacterium]